MRRIIISLSIIGVVAAIATGVTIALFNDTETSTGNIFVAGTMDLKVDHVYATYNGGECVGDCQETGSELVVNGGFETPDVPAGGWAIYPDGSLTSWNIESGSGLEIQDNAAGAPHGGNQLAELDSYNSSAISQNITTVAGNQYRLRFWYSPRPNRPAGDNTIDYFVKVVSDGEIILSGQIGASDVGGSNTSWQEFVYNFIATSNSTKIMFSDAGNSNSYGGYLDDISVKELACSSTFPNGGTCTLWDEKDLGPGDYFWNFGPDMKPGDWGRNVISLHAYNNDAWACLIVHDKQDSENTRIEPEINAGDTTDVPGELSQYIEVGLWLDSNENNQYDFGETVLYEGSLANEPTRLRVFDSTNGLKLVASDTYYIGLAWCFGDQTINQGTGQITCDGSGNNDKAQTDSLVAKITAYAEQWRNDTSFDCANVVLP